jgi:D-alanyl-D-alanine carboxypeptidase
VGSLEQVTPRSTRRQVVQAAVLGSVATLVAIRNPASAAQTATPSADAAAEQAFSPEVQLALHEIVDRGLAETGTPGALIGIWYPGQGTWVHAAGIGNLATGAPVTLDDHFRIGSITKTMTATVVLQLVDEGKITLDDRLDQYVPGVPNGDRITVRQVLGMTAGIADFLEGTELGEEFATNALIDVSLEQVLDFIRASTPTYEPGEQVQYSNSNYLVLDFLIAAVTGQTAAMELTQRIFTPLQMTGSSFPLTPTMPEPVMHGYFAPAFGDPLVDLTRSNPAFVGAAGAVIATLADLHTWVIALAEGTLLTPATQRARFETRSLSTDPLDEGYGLGVLTVNGMIGHFGDTPGYGCGMFHDPGTKASIIAVTNREGESGRTTNAILAGILTLFFPERFAALAPAAEGTPAAT